MSPDKRFQNQRLVLLCSVSFVLSRERRCAGREHICNVSILHVERAQIGGAYRHPSDWTPKLQGACNSSWAVVTLGRGWTLRWLVISRLGSGALCTIHSASQTQHCVLPQSP